jgi:hypothetical protein
VSLRNWRWIFFAFLLSTSALAESSPVVIQYVAPADCPVREEFLRELATRSSRLTENKPLYNGLFVDLRVSTTGAHYVGQVKVTGAAGTFVERELSGPSCADVASALALVLAITLDEFAPETPAAETKVPSAPATHQRSTSFALGPVVGLHYAIAPHRVPTIGLAVSVSHLGQLGTTELRVAGVLGLGTTETVTDDDRSIGDAQFRWFSTRTLGCPLLLTVGPSQLGPCLVFELGALRGTGSSSAGELSSTGVWLAPGAAFDWTLLAAPIRFGWIGGLVRPLVRDSFVFAPRPEVFRPPVVGLIAEFEISWHFS